MCIYIFFKPTHTKYKPLNFPSSLFLYLVAGIKKKKINSYFFAYFHPADAASLYMLSSGDVRLFEVKAFEEDFHSWFVGQTVQRGWYHDHHHHHHHHKRGSRYF